MNVLLHASNLRFGGGLTVALNLIDAVAPQLPEDHLYVISPAGVGYEALTKHPNIILLPVPDVFHHSWLQKMKMLHRNFPAWCKSLKIDKVVSLGNVGMPTRGRPQLLYIQLPHLVYHESAAWKNMDLRSFLRNSLMDQYVALHMRYATSFAVQTEVMRQRLLARFRLNTDHVFLIPNAALDAGHVMQQPLQMPVGGEPLQLLFLSKYYPHKGFESLPEIGRIIREKDLPIRIAVMLDKSESAGAASTLEAITSAGLSDIIPNIGAIRLEDIGTTVEAYHGIFLPSLMESFSGAYAEALQHRRLIFTSHYDFATELLGDAAFYFNPLNPEQMVRVITAAMQDVEVVRQKLQAMEQLAATMPGWAEVGAGFARLIHSFS